MAENNKEAAVAVHDLHKTFVLPQHKTTSIKQAFINIVRRNNAVVQKVLDGVSLEVEKGDFFGIVGRNGSGKSTLLKILAGVYTPTSGSVEINGKLTPFIELGVGFNPELSGRDNVFLNGALLGFSRKEMAAMYDEIVEFAELEPFMDQKLKNYSSGMQVRLAFSIAIKAHNEILIFDEVLAVGDEAFQQKCRDILESYKAEKRTIILVTHDMDTVRNICTKAVLLSDGKIIKRGNPHEVADAYSRLNQVQIDAEVAKKNTHLDSDIKANLLNYDTLDPQNSFDTGDEMLVDMHWASNPAIDAIVVDIIRMSGELVTSFKSIRDGQSPIGKRDKALIRIKTMIAPGSYYFRISFRDEKDKEVRTVYETAHFTVIKNWEKAGAVWSGLVPVDHEWVEIG